MDVLLAPTINLHRTPFGGRHFECFSEDPYLTAEIGRAYVDGLQSAGMAATIKHYMANDSATERFIYEAVIDERPLRELYRRPFDEIIASARPWLVMASYHAVNDPARAWRRATRWPTSSPAPAPGCVTTPSRPCRSAPASATRPGPGETVAVDVTAPRRQFAHWSAAEHCWICEPGTFEVLAGDSAGSVPLRGTWDITQQ